MMDTTQVALGVAATTTTQNTTNPNPAAGGVAVSTHVQRSDTTTFTPQNKHNFFFDPNPLANALTMDQST